jgi:hypothetical protein
MKIQSSFKDYYDFVANQYGGGDPRVVYERKRLSSENPEFGSCYGSKKVLIQNCPLIDPGTFGDEHSVRLMYLIIAGKAYLITHPDDDSSIDVNTYQLTSAEDFFKTIGQTRKNWQWFYPQRFGVEFEKEHPFLIELSRVVGAPVFAIRTINHGYPRTESAEIVIHGQCPVLEKIGFPALIPATQMYQDLAYFVGNTMKPVPDTDPPVAVSNREKILKAGFDLKRSFRHRL